MLSYRIPTYKVGGRRLFLGVWKHGVSIYGWPKDQDGGFVARHPTLQTSTGTIRPRPEEAAGISDEEFLDLVRAAPEHRKEVIWSERLGLRSPLPCCPVEDPLAACGLGRDAQAMHATERGAGAGHDVHSA